MALQKNNKNNSTLVNKFFSKFLKNKDLGIKSTPSSILGFNQNLKVSTEKGIPKPTRVSFNQLRAIARYDAVIRICVNAIKKEVSQCSWNLIPMAGKEVSEAFLNEIEEKFLLVNTQGENLRILFDRVIEDILVLDAGVIEKVHNANGDVTDLNSLDAATIRPILNKYGEMDPNKAYVQVINNKVVAEFKLNELIYIMSNPQTDIRLYGYGMSPIESILLAVQSALSADLYNARAFSEDNIPPGMLDLGDMDQEAAEQFMSIWDATVVDNTRKLKFVWGSDNKKKYVPFITNNKDMQFVEYIDWLSRIKLANYGLTPLDANITHDLNRATAYEERSISQSRGVGNMKSLLEEYIYREILIPMGAKDVAFKFDRVVTMEEKKKQAEIDKIYIETGVITSKEVAEREGFDYENYMLDDESDYGVGSPNPEDKEDDKGGGEKESEDDAITQAGDETKKGKRKGKYFAPIYED